MQSSPVHSEDQKLVDLRYRVYFCITFHFGVLPQGLEGARKNQLGQSVVREKAAD
ncbi:hypothetical protein D3C76_1633640 [compost metagenome]